VLLAFLSLSSASRNDRRSLNNTSLATPDATDDNLAQLFRYRHCTSRSLGSYLLFKRNLFELFFVSWKSRAVSRPGPSAHQTVLDTTQPSIMRVA
jgi:hypothetical protein